MAYREKVLRKKVEKLELKGLQNNKVIPEHLSGLEKLLHDVFLTRQPKPSDYNNRRDLVRVFNAITKELYGDCGNFPAVKEFGSFLMDLFSSKSDLDLSVNFSSDAAEFSRDKKIKTLRKFAKKFYALQRKGHVFGVQPILTARVPILKVVDTGTGIECDISVENRDGILKSQIVQIISSIDERFQKLCFLMKAWAKTHDINSSKDRTLNSLSIILLVTFHLQTRDPPILPPFSAIFKDGTDPASVLKSVNNFLNYGKGNKESLAKLFVTLLIKLSSVSTLWSKGLCASTYQGAWISKVWDSKVGCISIEDFTDRSQNVARAVGTAQVQKINQCIQHSIRYLFDFMNGSIQEPKLRAFLFGPDATIPPLVDTGTTNYEEKPELPLIMAPRVQPLDGWRGTQHAMSYKHTSKHAPTVRSGEKRRGKTTSEVLGHTQQVMLSDPTLTKKMRATEGWGGMPSESWRATSNGSWGGTTTGHWGESQHPVTLDPMRVGYMLPTVGWQCRLDSGGMQPAISAGPIWGGTRQASLISSIGNQVSRASLKHHYTLNENPVCETSSGSLLQPNFVSQHRALGFDPLRSINEVVPAPYIKQNPRYGPPYNPYGTQ